MGQVRLAQLAATPSEPIPFLVTGDMLQLKTDHLERSTIDVQGNATERARVQAQGMLLEGSNLHVSQRENLMWSEGPGRTRLPANAKKDGPAVAGRPELVPKSPVWISWQGGMDFDGQLIRFMKKVEVSGVYTSEKGEQLYLRSVGDQLHAKLNRYVEFAKTKTTDGLDVAELRFLGDVYTENQTFDINNTLTSQDSMRARDLTLDRQSGQFNAVGPGWIITTRVDDGELKESRWCRPGATTDICECQADRQGRANLSASRFPECDPGQFESSRRRICALRACRLWTSRLLGPDSRPRPSRWARRGRCGHDLQPPQGRRYGQWKDAIARVVSHGKYKSSKVIGFLAKADRLTYAEAKDQLIFESSGHNFAMLQRRSLVGAEPDEFQARKIMYWLNTGQVKVMNAKELNYNQIGSPSMIPNARIR